MFILAFHRSPFLISNTFLNLTKGHAHQHCLPLSESMSLNPFFLLALLQFLHTDCYGLQVLINPEHEEEYRLEVQTVLMLSRVFNSKELALRKKRKKDIRLFWETR